MCLYIYTKRYRSTERQRLRETANIFCTVPRVKVFLIKVYFSFKTLCTISVFIVCSDRMLSSLKLIKSYQQNTVSEVSEIILKYNKPIYF